jgi:hypothetical protein
MLIDSQIFQINQIQQINNSGFEFEKFDDLIIKK